ncbi:MAG: pyridoxine 5'-phosphate synthase [Candidatus Omnitrophota bacterium]|nr:pyridoxine 5'-phosphate synthase [Candidatus Omnitrophota bacterium]
MRLGVNIDHVATLRQQRREGMPDPLEAARVCERAGASSIVCHLREDRRHVQDDDVRHLKRALRVPLNLEMSIAEEIVQAALAIQPAQVTLVPERRQELTTEGGLDVARLLPQLRPLITRFHEAGINVSLFVDPDPKQLDASREAGARIVELHTGRYAQAASGEPREREVSALRQAAEHAVSLRLAVAAGHGLDYNNIHPVAAIRQIEEVNIGFSIISRALFVGLEQAVRQMQSHLSTPRSHAAAKA